MAVVIKWENEEANGNFNLKLKKAVTLGRNDQSDIILKDSLCSSIHCEMELLKGSKIRIADKGSKNGVYLNGTKIEEESVYLEDELLVGDTKLEIVASELTEAELDDLTYKGNRKERLEGSLRLSVDEVPYEPRGLRRAKESLEEKYNFKDMDQMDQRNKKPKKWLRPVLFLLAIALIAGYFWFKSRYRIIL